MRIGTQPRKRPPNSSISLAAPLPDRPTHSPIITERRFRKLVLYVAQTPMPAATRSPIRRPKTAAERKARVSEILRRLDQMYPNVTCALVHRTPWELLVSTILSAQCTDKRVNEVTPGLFKKYPSIQDFAAVRPEVLAQDIRSTGFFNNKAKSITGAAKRILS